MLSIFPSNFNKLLRTPANDEELVFQWILVNFAESKDWFEDSLFLIFRSQTFDLITEIQTTSLLIVDADECDSFWGVENKMIIAS